jgi:hypothetical protein
LYGFANAEDIFDRFDGISLSNEFPDYMREIAEITGQIDYRGMPMIMSYAHNNPILVFDVPSLGIHQPLTAMAIEMLPTIYLSNSSRAKVATLSTALTNIWPNCLQLTLLLATQPV